MQTGKIIFLNGTSSSGKTTIAKALQEKLTEPYMLVSIDGFFDLYPERYLNPTSQDEASVLARLIPAVVSGFHKSITALAKSGNNVIVDHVLQESEWLNECVEEWSGVDVLLVGIKCPLEVAEHRERQRGDRDPGTARYQFKRVHNHGLYDVEVDTSILTLDLCVTSIMDRMANKPKQSAFQTLAARLLIDK